VVLQMGRIPDFGPSPKDRRLTNAVFYYKDLRKSMGAVANEIR